MRRDRPIAVRLLLQLMALLVTLVVSAPFAAARPLRGASTPVVCAADEVVSTVALKAGHRAEPSISKAPLLDRIPPVPPSGWVSSEGRIPRAEVSLLLPRSGRTESVSIVKHVPRMERGDPPRI